VFFLKNQFKKKRFSKHLKIYLLSAHRESGIAVDGKLLDYDTIAVTARLWCDFLIAREEQCRYSIFGTMGRVGAKTQREGGIRMTAYGENWGRILQEEEGTRISEEENFTKG
jgi:hypothetical protein